MKKALIAVAAIALVLVGSIFLLPLALSSDTLRTALARQLSDASGAEIALNGPIHFSIIPDFGIVAEDLAYKTGDGAVSVAAARSVASVSPLPLLSGQVHVTGIELRSPRIVLGDAAAPAQPAVAEASDEDVFKTIAGYLERLSVDNVVVTDGEVARNSAGTVLPMASSIELRLSAPGISAPASLVVSGVLNGNRMELSADIGSLEKLLARQPADFSLSAKAEQPLHPMLADLSASGSIQLADDGSYRIAGGEIRTLGQTMQLDASYTPGDRPYVMAQVAAGHLDYSDFQPAQTASTETAGETAAGPGGGVDLSALRDIDADLQLRAQALQAGDAVARDVAIGMQLRNGQLNSTVSSAQIAGGSLAASIAMDVNATTPQSTGALDLSAIDIESLMALAGQKAPATGRLSTQLQYAFLGLDAVSIRDSLNLRGDVSLSGGRVEISQLETMLRPGAGVVDALEANVRIEDVLQPLALSGTARWNGEAIGFTAALALSDLLWGQPGQVTLDLKSRPLNAGFAGTLGNDGAVSGKAEIAAPSLAQATAWLGQDIGTQLGRFAFSGGIAASSSQVALTEASIGLDDMQARGSLSVTLAGKPKITAALSVDSLDFGRLTGGGNANATAASSGPTPIDLSVLRLFDADIRLEANQLGYGDVRAGPATATLAIADGVARLAIPQAGFYDGVVSASVTANGAGAVPSIDLTAGMEGVQALPLLTAAGNFQNLEGRLKASVEVSGAGADSAVFARSLRGPVALVFSDGALRGIDVAGAVRNVQSLLAGGYTANAEAKTEFTELSVAVDIQDGVGRVGDIRLLGPFVRMSGSGSVDLAAQTIDMRLDPRVVASLDGQGSDFDVSGLGMPIIVTGPLSRPSLYPDISGLLADPNRALQALSQLGGAGGGLGDLAGGASGAIEGLGQALGSDPGALTGSIVNDLVGQFGSGQSQPAPGGTPSNEQALMNSVLQGVFGQPAPAQPTADPLQAAQSAPPAETTQPPATPSQAPAGAVPLPRSDPRGPFPTASAPAPVPEPAAPAPAPQSPADVLLPQLLPDADDGTTDAIKGLLEQMGM